MVEESKENVKRYFRKRLFEYDVNVLDFGVVTKISVGNSMLHTVSNTVCNTNSTAPKRDRVVPQCNVLQFFPPQNLRTKKIILMDYCVFFALKVVLYSCFKATA